jgi:hypothetical protein
MKATLLLMSLCVIGSLVLLGQSVPEKPIYHANDVQLFKLDTSVFDSIMVQHAEIQKNLRDYMKLKDIP